MMKNLTIGAALAAAVWTLSGCGAADDLDAPAPAPAQKAETLASRIATQNQDADRNLKLLVRLELSDKELLEFYEPDPGLVAVSLAGAPTEKPVLSARDIEGREPLEIWNRATNSRPLPAALASALERTKDRAKFRAQRQASGILKTPAASGGSTQTTAGAPTPVDSPAAPVRPRVPADGVGSVSQGVIGGFCDSYTYDEYYGENFDPNTGTCPYWDWSLCRDNWTGGFWAYHPDANHFKSNTCAVVGSVTMKISSDEWSGGTWNVPEDTLRWYEAMDHGCGIYFWNDCASARLDVTNATNDRFHVRFVIDESN